MSPGPDNRQSGSSRAWSIRPDGWLVLILSVSVALRAILAWRGGVLYYPDEGRYYFARDVLDVFMRGDTSKALEMMFSRADHLGFRVIMLIPALFQSAWNLDYRTIAFLGSGMFSVVSILLGYCITRRAGGGREEARWTALFMAVSNSMFYWARHLLPYDMALSFALGCLFVGVHPKPGWHRSLTAGFFGFCAFVTYNGCWTFVVVALAIHVLRGWPSFGRIAVRAVLGFIGLSVPMLVLIWWAAGRGYPLVESYYTFSNSITQGDFREGHRLILEYLWASERGLLLVWLGCAAWIAFAAAGRRDRAGARAWMGLGGVLAVCASLVWFSDFAEKFVVYGRLIRQTVPFFALLGGAVMADVCARREAWKWLRPCMVAFLVALGASNFATPLRQRWDFFARASLYRDAYRERSGATEVQRIPLDRFQLVMQGFLWPAPKPMQLPPHEVLMREPHLLEFRPLLYEGYTREQRQVVMKTDISDKLILLKVP